MGLLASAPWVAVVAPLALALLSVVAGRSARWVAPAFACVSAVIALAVAASSLAQVLVRPEGTAPAAPWLGALVSHGEVAWFRIGGTSVTLGWGVDGLASLMLLVVGTVALAVVVFSIGYMHGDAGHVRYFSLLSLFVGAMSLLVISSSLVGLFMGWELVGACSYLLIGFWYQKPSAAAAAMKAFLTTRVGDVALLAGMAILYTSTRSLEYEALCVGVGTIASASVTIAAVCIAIGAMGKSAQFPLHAWLPDAMEGPTPVSALIHAATMVAAGVFLVVRVWPLFEAAPVARLVLLGAGAISAFGAALAAVPQRDIKKVLAYSTISQLGFMFASLGAGAFAAAFFHLITHAAFKALLFLTSGSVIHGSGTQDLHEMGALRRSMPWTFAAWSLGVLALCGIPPFSGFFSKDAILESVLKTSPGIGLMLLAATAVTAFYSARVTRLAFFGLPTDGSHVHESGPTMLAPLGLLAALASVAGLFGGPVMRAMGHESEPLVPVIAIVSFLLAVLGGAAGWSAAAGPQGDRRTAQGMAGLWDLLGAGYRYDGFIQRCVVAPVVTGSRVLWSWCDRLVVDGVITGVAAAAMRLGDVVRAMHRGDAQDYATVMAVAVAVMLAVTVWLGVR